MAPPKKLPKTEEAAKEQGLSSMTSFFSLKPKPGRPTKNSSKAGRKAAAESPDAAAVAAPTAAAAKPQAKKVAVARRNWSKGEGLKAMTDAVAEWEQEQKKPEKERTSLRFFAEQHNISYTTLQTHITSNDAKRIKLGSSAGRKSIISCASAEIISDVLIRKDRVNQGVGVRGAVDILQEMHPEHTRKQLDQSFRRKVRPDHSERLTNLVAVQNTTTKRTAITVPQQYRWHKVNI